MCNSIHIFAIMVFEYGFEIIHKGIIVKYVWDKNKQDLFRLPYTYNGRYFATHRINPKPQKGTIFYLIQGSRKTRGGLLSLTHLVNWEVDILEELLPQ